MRPYQILFDFTASADAAVQVQILKAGRIRQVSWAIMADFDADAERYGVELSSVPTYLANVAGAQGVISNIRDRMCLTTDGAMSGAVNHVVSVDWPVSLGQLIYLNAVLVGTADVSAYCQFLVDDGS